MSITAKYVQDEDGQVYSKPKFKQISIELVGVKAGTEKMKYVPDVYKAISAFQNKSGYKVEKIEVVEIDREPGIDDVTVRIHCYEVD